VKYNCADNAFSFSYVGISQIRFKGYFSNYC